MMLESGNGSRTELSRRGGERYNKRRGAVEDWEISYDKIVFKEQIGCGSFGTVYKAYYFGDKDNPECHSKIFITFRALLI